MDESHLHGLQVVYEPDTSTKVDLDVVAVNGLHGHPLLSWTSAATDQSPCMWLQDLLPKHMRHARIMVFGYNSDSAGENALLSAQGVANAATKLLECLAKKRADSQYQNRPITFIAHDLGGMVVKKALIMATENSSFFSISKDTYQLVFFGTPHRAKDMLSWDELILNIFVATSSTTTTTQDLPSKIRAFSKISSQITAHFNSLRAKYSIVNLCQDGHQGSMSGGETIVVNHYSSRTDLIYDKNIERHRKHQDLCKFDKADEEFFTILKVIKTEGCDRDYLECLSTFRTLSPAFSIPSEVQGSSGNLADCLELKDWLADGHSPAIYFYGPPGVGKNVFSGTLLRTLRKQNLQNFPIAYFSFSDQDQRQTSSTALMGSLIYQILSQEPHQFESVRDMYRAIKRRSIWSFEALWNSFHSLLVARDSGSIFCIVDQIHNCDSSRTQFLNHLLDHRRKELMSTSLKVILIGELRQDVYEFMKTCPKFRLNVEISLKRIFEARVEYSIAELMEENPLLLDLKSDLREKLHNCENFLQLSVTLDILMGRKGTYLSTQEAVRSEIQGLPYNISDQVKTKTLNLPEWARKSLGWILHAQRPMTIDELAAAITLVEDVNTIRFDNSELPFDLSADMKQGFGPFFKVENSEVRWSHEEIKKFFKSAISDELQIVDRTKSEFPLQHATQHLDHWSITRILLKYLCSERFINPVKRALKEDTWTQPRGPFFDMMTYAVHFWPLHYRKAKESGSYAEPMLEYLKNTDLIRVWWELKSRLGSMDVPPDMIVTDPLSLAAHLGFGDVVEIYLKAEIPENVPFASRGTAITLASRAGHLDILTKLVDNDFDKEMANDARYLTEALLKASDQGHDHIVEFLIEHIPKPTDRFVWDPVLLCRAAEIGYETLVNKFTTAGAEVDVAYEGSTPLQLAAKNGHESIVKHLLSRGAAVNSEAAEDSFKPIMHAAKKGYTKVVQHLIEYEVAVRQSNSEGQTALHLAAQHGHQEITRLLLQRAPDLAARDRKGRTALHLASLNGHAEVIETLVPNSVVDPLDGNGETPLRLASKNGHLSAVKVLLESGARVDLTGTDHHTALHCATVNNYESVAEVILRCGNTEKVGFADIVDVLYEAAKLGFLQICELCLPFINDKSLNSGYKKQRTALHHAAQNGNDGTVRLLLDKGTDVDSANDEGKTPLVVAAIAGKSQVVQILLARKANPFRRNCEGQTLVSQLADLPHINSIDGYVNTVRILLKAGIAADDVDRSRRSALHYAVRTNNLKIAEELLVSGADPNLQDYMFWTPLHYAARNNKAFSKLLLKYKADPQIHDNDGWTPFHIAARYGTVDVMEVLWKVAPTVIRRKSNRGKTSLHFAHKELESTKWLLDHDAAVDAPDGTGKTALITAAQSGSDEVVSLLLSHNADPQLRDNFEKTALHYAAENGSVSVGQRLLDKDISIINYMDDKQRSALHLTIQKENRDFARMLLSLESHININLQDEDGNSPLLLAVSAGKKMQDLIQLLVEAGADTELRNKAGQTALLVAGIDSKENWWKSPLNKPN